MENILWKFVCTFVHEYGSGMWSTFARKLEPTFLFYLVQCKNTLHFVIPFALQIKGVLESFKQDSLFLCHHVSVSNK